MAVGKEAYLSLETRFLMCLETLTDAGNEGFKHRNWYDQRRAGFPLLSVNEAHWQRSRSQGRNKKDDRGAVDEA